jgi:nitrogen fixation/metabolism regulation signal transduction histidine kinase
LLIAGVIFLLLTALGAEIAANIFIKPFDPLKADATKVAAGEADGNLMVTSKDECCSQLSKQFSSLKFEPRGANSDFD